MIAATVSALLLTTAAPATNGNALLPLVAGAAVGVGIVYSANKKDKPKTSLPPKVEHLPAAEQKPLATKTPISTPPPPPPPPPPIYKPDNVAISVLNYLVDNADKKQLGGCVILAAPGAGKTTFLGTVWARLKEKYKSNFKSLAVIVKESDVEFFKDWADQAIAVKKDPTTAAVSIIKFIDKSMKSGDVSRVFLDDFLTMNLCFSTSLRGFYINPSNYSLYMNNKERTDAQDFSAVPLLGHLFTTLNEAWLVGREYNLCLWVSSHSPNVNALPFVGSRDSRSVGNLIFLACADKMDFINQALDNPNLIPSNSRRNELKQMLSTYKGTNSRFMLSNTNNWVIGEVPNSIYEEYMSYRTKEPDVIMPTDALKEPLRTIWKFAAEKQDWCVVRDIQRKDYAVLKGINTAQDIAGFVAELERQGYLEVQNDKVIKFRVLSIT